MPVLRMGANLPHGYVISCSCFPWSFESVMVK